MPQPPVLNGGYSPYFATIYNMTPQFQWRTAYSLGNYPYNRFEYSLIVSNDSTFQFTSVVEPITDTVYLYNDSLLFNERYWWKLKATNSFDISMTSSPIPFYTWKLGDVDNSHNVDIADLVYLIDFMFLGGASIEPVYAGDIDGSCTVDIADLVYFVTYMFSEGPPPQVGCELITKIIESNPMIEDSKVEVRRVN